MNYALIYQQLVERARSRVTLDYTERHHIVPRCLGGSDEPSNLVDLLPGEHLFAHRLLCRMHPTNGRLAYAVVLLAGHVKGRPSRLMYAADKQRITDAYKLKQLQEDELVVKSLKRRKSPTKRKQTLQEWHKELCEKHPLKELPRGVKVGNRWVTNGETSRHVRGAEFDSYIAQGWRPGRKVNTLSAI